MPQWDEAGLSEPQRRWFASLREGLVRETGRDLPQWVELARACPQTGHRARLAWMKATHGLGQNRASVILREAFPATPPADDADPLWRDPAARAMLEAVQASATGLDGVVTGRRKGYTAFSRRYQFAAVRPHKAAVRLGLAVPPEANPRLAPAGQEGWSERLASVVDLDGVQAVDATVGALLRQAWERS